jgi:hypothetical protein|tara:strand:+ start:3660 stop:4523 length:864 start_codon:yes stop_codon:yes gene_type:complete
MSNINFFRVLQSGGFGGSSGGEIDWDDFTLSKTSPNLSVVAIDLDVNPDQTEIFFAPNSTKRIDVYDFDTTGDVSDGFTFSTTGTTLNKWPQSFQFNPTGTKIFAIMRNSSAGATTGIYQYNLSTAWDTSTMSSTEDEYVAFSTLDSNILSTTGRAFAIDEDGLNIYFSAFNTGGAGPYLYRLPLSTAFDLSSYGTISSSESPTATQIAVCSFNINTDRYVTYTHTTSGQILKNGIDIPGDQVDSQTNIDERVYITTTPDNETFFGLNQVNPGSGYVSIIYQFTTSF